MTENNNHTQETVHGHKEKKAKLLFGELETLLENVYMDIEVSRQKVEALVKKGEEMAAEAEGWTGGEAKAMEFLEALNKINKKINQTIDLKKLKDEGLVKAVKL